MSVLPPPVLRRGSERGRRFFCQLPWVLGSVLGDDQANGEAKEGAGISPAAVALKVKRCEVVSGVAWLLIGIVQLLMVYTAAAGVWNVINAIVALRNCKNITPGNLHVVPYFEGRKVWLIVMAVVNLILGGVVGVLLVLFDWHVRDFVLRNRSAFEG